MIPITLNNIEIRIDRETHDCLVPGITMRGPEAPMTRAQQLKFVLETDRATLRLGPPDTPNEVAEFAVTAKAGKKGITYEQLVETTVEAVSLFEPARSSMTVRVIFCNSRADPNRIFGGVETLST